MRFRLIVAALLALLSSHALAFDPTKAPRYGSPDMYRPNVDGVIFRGNSSRGDISGTTAIPDPWAETGTLAYQFGRTGGTPTNLWYNPDGGFGPGQFQIVTNDILSTHGPDGWQTQQGTLTPFMSTSRTVDAQGRTAVRMTNGYPFSGSYTVGTGTKTFTVGTGLNFAAGLPGVKVVQATNLANSMTGTITGYDAASGVLTLNVTAVTGSGTYSDWVVGRDGKTTQDWTLLATTQASAPGSYTLTFADTGTVQIGAAVESRYGSDVNHQKGYNGIKPSAYVVAKTPTTVTMSAPVTADTDAAHPTPGVQAGQQIRFYSDLGTYVFQDIQTPEGAAFRYGTSEARTACVQADVRAFGISGRASLAMFGYSSGSTLGRSYADTFPVTGEWSRMALCIPGDKVGYANTWKAGIDGNAWRGAWGTIGFAWSAEGTVTSKLITPGVWQNSQPDQTPPSPAYATAGAAGQTLDLPQTVGAWVEVTGVCVTLDKPAPCVAPVTFNYPFSRRVEARTKAIPRFVWNATDNPVGLKKWQAYLKSNGVLGFGKLTDDEAGETSALFLNPDGAVGLPAYADGTLSVNGGQIGSTPYAFQDYTPPVVNSAGGATFGTTRGRVRVVGKTMMVHLEIPVTTPGNGAGVIIANLPRVCNARTWVWSGVDSTAGNGSILVGFVPPNSSAMQIRRGDGAFPAVAGSTLNLSGWCELP